jgi:D-alanine transaminase
MTHHNPSPFTGGWPARPPSGRIAYVNGRFVPHSDASVHVEDRGLQFADAVYEVYAVSEGHLLDEDEHSERLERSLRELGMEQPLSRRALGLVVRELVRRNRFTDGLVYLQVTRGTARRDHAVPKARLRPTLILTARPVDPSLNERRRRAGIQVITRPDERWARRDVKSTALLPNILAKTAARDAGAFEAWLIDSDGYITEGSSTTAWIVDSDGTLITRDLSNAILPGVTRRVMIKALADFQVPVREHRFTLAEALAAKEAFISAATLGAMPVIAIDGNPVGDGKPGPVTLRVQDIYHKEAERRADAKSGQKTFADAAKSRMLDSTGEQAGTGVHETG